MWPTETPGKHCMDLHNKLGSLYSHFLQTIAAGWYGAKVT